MLFYIYGYVLVSPYILGDQKHYRELYALFSNTDFTSILLVAPSVIGSSEPVSLFILWIGSSLSIDKDIYISFWNAVLLFGLFKLARKNRFGVFFITLLLTNFYVVVLLTGAERLKFSFIFIVYFYLFSERKFISWFLLILAVFSHFQTLLFIFGLCVYRFLRIVMRMVFLTKLNYKLMFSIVPVSIVFIVFIVFFGNDVSQKISYYIRAGSFFDLVKLLIFLPVAFLSARRRFDMLLMIVVFFPVVYLLGGDRVNMIVFMLVLFNLIIERKANAPFFLLLMIYFSLKSIEFIINIFSYGNGF